MEKKKIGDVKPNDPRRWGAKRRIQALESEQMPKKEFEIDPEDTEALQERGVHIPSRFIRTSGNQ